MTIKDISIESLTIPFRTRFEHSVKSRAKGESILIRINGTDHIKTLGEGCPRLYVTGETINTAECFFYKHKATVLQLKNIAQLQQWMSCIENEIDENPAAFCAIENALLNYFAQVSNQSVERLLGVPELSGEFTYTAVLGARSEKAFAQQLIQYKKLFMGEYKIKLFADLEIDKRNLQSVVSSINDLQSIRYDANNCWDNAASALTYLHQLNVSAMGIEEPLQPFDFEGCGEIARTLGTRIILDESFLNQKHFEEIQSDPLNWIINIRISKMGGILRSLDISKRARELSIPIIIGAQVGETSLLSRSALTVANASRDILKGQEGAFGTNLLEYDIVEPSIMFGYQGKLKVP